MAKKATFAIFILLPIGVIIVLVLGMLISGEYMGPGSADYRYHLSGTYQLERDSNTDIIITNTEEHVQTAVPKTVSGIAWDEHFILAAQNDFEKSSAKDTTYYWIISVDDNKIYGSMSKSEFVKKRSALHVDENLKLEKPEKYKYLDSGSAGA